MMKALFRGRQWLPSDGLSFVVLLGALVSAPSVHAEPSYLTAWSSTYPASVSDTIAGCQLCHGSSNQNLNPYGAAICVQGGGISTRLQTVETEDSDTDPTGSDNITEINASTQPGWTPGFVNVVFNSGTCSALGGTEAPPASILGDLDPPLTNVDLSGTIKTSDGTDICAMVLASGQFMFSCNPVGVFSLTDLPRENDGTVKRKIYADGFFPKIDLLNGTSNEAVVLTRSGPCPSYNPEYDPAVVPGSAGNRIDISGKVLLQDSQTPICAMVLANGQFMFSCDGSGSYALNIPLDFNGQFKLQVYADGFAPTIQVFDEFSPTNDVRMARASECQ